ncbi:putative bifunctional diguanylate cyclase/phosphodiesterase [Devosia psychrophila]|uniref:PAS domain S-box-containing protein/diguanylate cyclase (GGDEF) domain-containing protein n=1 Tax=Devosia psychrophila TaxID=728005 RepID=A0A1I1N9Z2_9HYPH|nr:EAL domain-containing protein [Devosia psychrophila]SFC94166.1 PAS domain S-box-containing protein/diguanylate cyclase (GGDEF) domain-containing protein [Devosia psychrophila]
MNKHQLYAAPEGGCVESHGAGLDPAGLELDLVSTRAFLDAVVESIPHMVFVKDVLDGRFVLLNRAGEQLLGLKREDLIGKTDFDLFSPDDAERFRTADREVVASQKLVTIENEPLSTPDGTRSLRTQKVGVPDAHGNPRYLLGISEDVTERLKVEERNRHLSLHDILTDLPNRRSFEAALNHELMNRNRFSLLVLDLDGFKVINDTMGHRAGDDLLRQLSSRLSEVKGEHDFLARLGGDEFGVIHRAATKKSSTQLASRLISALTKPFEVEERLVSVGASLGIVLSPDFGNTPDNLTKRADLALYAAKAAHRGSHVFFEPAMEEKADTEHYLREELAFALKRSQLHIVYQPIVDTRSGRIVCCEALLRWTHPQLGPICPDDFIPVAEASGQIAAIGKWVLETACKEARNWPSDIRLAVNVSPRQFTGFGLAVMLARILERTKLAPSRLELEITESIFLTDSDENVRLLNQIKHLGVRIALDDFGTGYSSLAYLRKFSFDKLKIDKSFVSDLATSDCNLAIVRAIIGLGKSFSAVVTAEGVETEAEHARLLEEGCEQCQGHLFGRPVEAKLIREMLGHSRDRRAC